MIETENGKAAIWPKENEVTVWACDCLMPIFVEKYRKFFFKYDRILIEIKHYGL